MTYRELVEETETHRAFIVADPYPEEPDWDGQAHILYLDPRCHASYCDAGTVSVRHADYGRSGEAEDLASALQHAFHRHPCDGPDWELAERYLRAFYGAVSFDYMSWGDGALVFVVTHGLAYAWGCPTELAHETAGAAMQAWTQYAEGDVWGAVVEQLFHEHVERTSAYWGLTEEKDRDVWDEVESVWGYYGIEYAQEQAREMLAAYATS